MTQNIITEQTSPQAPSPVAPLYQVRNVGRTYKKRGENVAVLSNLNLEIAPGEFATIQGPTGGGKSTLLQLLGALDRPDEGSILLGTANLATSSNAQLTKIRREYIGFVFQDFNLIPTLNAFENVNTALEGRGISKEERKERCLEALAHVGLAERANHRQGELSGGQQQRVAIARAIVAEPHVLLADEPTGNLDEAMRNEILTLLEQLNAEGLTIIAVTHDSAVAARAKRRLHLQDGQIFDESDPLLRRG